LTMNEAKNQSEAPRIDYDGRWKRIIELFFRQFVEFFMPELLPDVDFSQPPEFLEQELATIIPEQTAKGRMSVDKLLKIPMTYGGYEHIFLHVEVQSQRKVGFTERNFKYFYRIFDSKGKAITAFVIYTNDDVFEPHDRYIYEFRGTKLTYEFSTYLVRDADEDELLKSDNIFALVILACKYINLTKDDAELRRQFKLKLFRLAIKRGYSNETLKALMNFINLLMYLPPKIDQEFWTELKGESKQSKMIVDRIMVLDKDANVHEALKEEFFKDFKAEFAEEVSTLKSEVEEQRKARMSIIRNLISSTSMQAAEIAEITGISTEEVLKIKTEIEEQK